MKITKTKLSLFLVCLLSFGLNAQETSENEIPEDTVENPSDTDTASETTSSDSDNETPETEDKSTEDNLQNSDIYDSYDEATPQSQKKNNFFNNLLKSSTNNFYEFDSMEVSSTNAVGQLKKHEAILVYLDSTDYYGFGSTYNAMYTYLLFDEKARNHIVYAADQYLTDFENKKLNRKAKNSEKKYGNVPLRITWGSVKFQAKNTGITQAKFGYKFKDNSPYFTITCPEAENEKYKISTTNPRASTMTQFYFTKAQLKDLVNFLSEENIKEIRYSNINFDAESDADTDSY